MVINVLLFSALVAQRGWVKFAQCRLGDDLDGRLLMAKQTLSDTAKEATMVKLKTNSLCFFFGAGSFCAIFPLFYTIISPTC